MTAKELWPGHEILAMPDKPKIETMKVVFLVCLDKIKPSG